MNDKQMLRYIERRLDEMAAPTRPQAGTDDRRYMIMVAQMLAPGEKISISSTPIDHDFQLDYVNVTDDNSTKLRKTKLFFHHDELVEKRLPASMILNPYSADVQRMDLYKKHRYAKGDVFVLGVFENVDETPLLMRAAIVGFAKVRSTG